jgi:hypothetical protein
MNLTKPSSHQNNNNQNSHQHFQHKSALVAADSKNKFSEIRLARKTSFLIPPSQGEESDEGNRADDDNDDEKESSDYISDFPEFKKAINSHRAAYIDLKKRKSSSSSQIGGAKLFTTGDSFDSVTNTMTKLPKSSQKRDNSNDDMHKNSKFRPTTPKVLFNYFPVTFISSKSKDSSSSNVLLTKSMNSVNHFGMGNTSAESIINRESQKSGGDRLPKINPAIKENLLSSRTHAKILNKTDDKQQQQQQQQKQHKNLFFPLLISNNTNSSTSISSGSNKNRNENKSIASNLNSYFDDPNGIFFLQSLSHLSMKNLNQT